ncbi:MAG: hypothetical protein Q8942_15945, partial [Bacillota bacterium]|nr:hypothetical protein [Bacillota bacterium]
MRKKVFYVIPILTLLIFAVSACPSFAAINISGNPSISCSFDSKPNVIVDGKAHTDSSNPSNSVKELTATINSKKNIYFNQVDGFNVGGSFDTQKQIVILMDTSGSLNDPGTTINSPFDYCLFSGSPTSEFYLHGTTFNINGKIHSNQFLRLNAGNFINANKDITDGICEYVTDKSVTGNVPLNYFKKSSVFPMPDLWTKLIDNKTTGFSTYSVNSANWRSAYVDVKNGQMVGQPNI